MTIATNNSVPWYNQTQWAQRILYGPGWLWYCCSGELGCSRASIGVVDERFLTICQDVFVPAKSVAESAVLSHVRSPREFKIHESDKPAASPRLL